MNAKLLQRRALALISFYQATLSPDHGFGRLFFPYWGCRFNPSCSEYTRQCIIEKGAINGILSGLKQLARCHPFSKSKSKSQNVKFQVKS